MPFSGIYNIGIRRDAPIGVIRKLQKVFVSAVNSDSFKAIANKRKFFIDIKLGEAADRRAAQLEALTAETFAKLKIPGAKSADQLGLPTTKGFDKWWPPKGYKPLPLLGSGP